MRTTLTTNRTGPRRRGGMAILEMAIVLPMMLYLAMGMVEYGQFFYLKNLFQQAARDATRAAIMPNAAAADPTTAATRTLAEGGITFQPSWMTMTDITPIGWGGSTLGVFTDCSTVPAGHGITLTIATTYGALPGAVRPLSNMNAPAGIPAARAIAGSSTALKE